MKKVIGVALAMLMLTSLSACMVVPAHDRPYYGEHRRYERHHFQHRDEGRSRRW